MIVRKSQLSSSLSVHLCKAARRLKRLNSTSVGPWITPITSILIANRGEIALRVSRTASQHGIRTTSIFTEPDAQSEHILASPFSVNLGDATAYLDGKKIIEVAQAQGCDAVHPGYGFLSENASFARQCAEAGLNFIGPSSDAIEAMGDKSRSKQIMLAANVPCTPGYHGSNQDPSFLQAQAENIGYPVLLKAVHGGGGKGMRIAHSPDTFAAQLESAKSEARNSFGNDTMLIEKYITRPRHVEVQIFGDKHGNVVSLGERDCSIQRRHQKIIEESPAPGLSNAQREDLWQKAIQAGKAVNYVGAGTVEFIFDANTGGFFFMEMNTRLQVEHPVTEMCTDLDLVEWQLRIARGEPIPLTQAQIQDRIARNGHAIEARIYAEDPEMDFLPTAGTLTHLALPEEIHGSVRIDTAIKQVPTTISSHYDPMISKLIVRGPDRETALRRLRSALERYEIAGLTTNIEFLKRLCANEHFVSDTTSLDTAFITKHHDELFEHEHTQPEVWAQAALGLFLRQSSLQPATSALNESIGFDSASTHSGFASRSFDLAANPTPTTARTRGPTVTVDIQQLARDRFTIVVQSTISKGSSESLRAVFKNVNAKLSSTQGPQSHVLSAHFPHTHLTSTVVLPSPDTVLDQGLSITLFDRGRRYDLTSPPPEWLRKALGKSPVAADEANVAAPMPSKILRVEIQAGEVVKKDQPLVVVESMKMEMVIRAPREGLVVKRVAYQAGEICKAGAVLVEFENESRTAIDPTA